jgi:hypothetical protein
VRPSSRLLTVSGILDRLNGSAGTVLAGCAAKARAAPCASR